MKGHKETCQVTNIFTTLIVVMVSQVNINLNYQIIHIQYVQFKKK